MMASEATEHHRFAGLQDRLTDLQDATRQLQGLIDRLGSLDFGPAGPVAVDAEGGAEEEGGRDVGSELGAEIIQNLREQEDELELLEQEMLDMRPPPERSAAATAAAAAAAAAATAAAQGELRHEQDRLREGAQRLKGELQRCRVSFRKAQISAKRRLQAAQRQERELLLASLASPRRSPSGGAASPVPTPTTTTTTTQQRRRQQQQQQQRPSRSEQTKEEQALGASSDVTEALRRTHDMMARELGRSEFAHRTLRESTATLSRLSDSYLSLDGMLSSSRDLLGTLLRSRKSETWYLQTSLSLLLATIGWLVFRRLFYGPLWWLLWLPAKVLFRAAAGLAGAVGLAGGGGGGGSLHRVGTKLDSGGRPVVVPQAARMNNEAVPTVQVGGREKKARAEEDDGAGASGSMSEQVGRIIDRSRQGGGLDERAGAVLDETVGQQTGGEDAEAQRRLRDEL